MDLQDFEGHLGEDGFDLLVRRVDEETDARGPPGIAGGKRGRLLGRERARRGREEDEADPIGAGLGRGTQRVRRVDRRKS